MKTHATKKKKTEHSCVTKSSVGARQNIKLYFVTVHDTGVDIVGAHSPVCAKAKTKVHVIL